MPEIRRADLATPPAAQELASFIHNVSVASGAIPGSEIRKSVLAYMNEQGFPAHVRIAVGDLIIGIVNSDPEALREVTKRVLGIR